MHEYNVDLPVLLIFFTRPDTLSKVFEKVKKARPSKLFLACDGPREGNAIDALAVEQCKKIVEDIDWDCEVYKNYSEKNMGCGMRPQTAIGWALSVVDRIVILEDDCVPDDSFFPYMAELLEKYKDDERIGMISGLNHLREWNCGGNSYCFTKTGAIWGWATWRRVWDNYDYCLNSVSDPHLLKLIRNDIRSKTAKKEKINRWIIANRKIKEGKNLSYWDVQFGFLKNRYSYLAIVPKHNLICNIGVGEGSTHAIELNIDKWKEGRLHFIPVKNLETPLIHPDYVVCDYEYDKRVDDTWLNQPYLKRWCGKIKRGLKKIIKIKR